MTRKRVLLSLADGDGRTRDEAEDGIKSRTDRKGDETTDKTTAGEKRKEKKENRNGQEEKDEKDENEAAVGDHGPAHRWFRRALIGRRGNNSSLPLSSWFADGIIRGIYRMQYCR